jgi:hypothetical protein
MLTQGNTLSKKLHITRHVLDSRTYLAEEGVWRELISIDHSDLPNGICQLLQGDYPNTEYKLKTNPDHLNVAIPFDYAAGHMPERSELDQ